MDKAPSDRHENQIEATVFSFFHQQPAALLGNDVRSRGSAQDGCSHSHPIQPPPPRPTPLQLGGLGVLSRVLSGSRPTECSLFMQPCLLQPHSCTRQDAQSPPSTLAVIMGSGGPLPDGRGLRGPSAREPRCAVSWQDSQCHVLSKGPHGVRL